MAQGNRGKINPAGGDRLLGKLSAEYEEQKPLITIATFIPACETVENGLLISNLAYILAERGANVCALDFKVFYPNLHYWLGAESQRRGDGLIKILRNDRISVKSVVSQTAVKNMFLLAPSPLDAIEDYYSFEFRHVETLIDTLKENFDVLLIDVPNNPPLEFCLGAMKKCEKGFFTVAERADAVANMLKLIDHAGSIGISGRKFNEAVFSGSLGSVYDFTALKKSGLSASFILPFVKEAWEAPLEGKLYLRDAVVPNKAFLKEIEKLADRFLPRG